MSLRLPHLMKHAVATRRRRKSLLGYAWTQAGIGGCEAMAGHQVHAGRGGLYSTGQAFGIRCKKK
jgi:hypothetical protein